MNYVHLVIGHSQCDASVVICAFGMVSDALAFKTACEAYDKTFTKPPEEPNDWPAWADSNTAWLKKHPAKQDYESYQIEKVELR